MTAPKTFVPPPPTNPSSMPLEPNTQATETLRHSGPGIAAFLLSILGGIIFIIAIVVALGAVQSKNTEILNFAGFALFAAWGLEIIAVILSIVGLVQKDRKKIFAILGLIFSVLILLVSAALVIIGTAIGAGVR